MNERKICYLVLGPLLFLADLLLILEKVFPFLCGGDHPVCGAPGPVLREREDAQRDERIFFPLLQGASAHEPG